MKESAAPTPQEIHALSLRWMEVFEQSARAQDRKAFERLFSKVAILFGVEKGGCLDWPMQIQFAFNRDQTKIAQFGSHAAVAITRWSLQPIVLGGQVKIGWASLVLQLFPKGGDKAEFLCVHAHFSC